MSAELFIETSQRMEHSRARLSPRFADRALEIAAQSWFATTIAGQLLFAFTVAAFYGMTAARGDMQAWNRLIFRGHVAGDGMGDFVVAMHLASAVLITLAGAVQLVPRIRARFPIFHRWTGRLYMLTAFTVTFAGLYMHYVRGTQANAIQRLGSVSNAVVIWLCVGMALRAAIQRDFGAHRRWAIRLFLAVSASWFFRVALFLSFLIFQGPAGFDPTTMDGPFLTFMVFADYLFPLAVAELYFGARKRPGVARRLAMAAGLWVLSLGTLGGVFAVSAAVWVPSIKSAFDGRKTIVTPLAATIASAGVEQAVQQYRQLKATAPRTYNFDENQLNRLGYQLARAKKWDDAIRVLQLNVEAYPRSSNVHDSLAEAYLGAGNKALAIAHYTKAVQLDPKNASSISALKKLGAR